MRSVEAMNDGLPDDDRHDSAQGVTADRDAMPDELDRLRAEHYDLLALLLGRSPSPEVIAILADLQGDASPLGQALAGLAAAAAGAELPAVQREYFDLFVGVGRGELVPFASYYLTGFLNERPLARLREDLRILGIEATGGMSEPEDHVAILMETMAGLCARRFGTPPGADRTVFTRHIEPWAGRFFKDLEQAQASRFYRAVGILGAAYMDIESQAYGLDLAS